MLPLSVWVPPVRVRPPVPPITPLKVSFAAVSVRVLPPKVTVPAPASVVMLAPEVVLLISKVPVAVTPLEVAILPEPESAKVPALMVVVPV